MLEKLLSGKVLCNKLFQRKWIKSNACWYKNKQSPFLSHLQEVIENFLKAFFSAKEWTKTILIGFVFLSKQYKKKYFFFTEMCK